MDVVAGVYLSEAQNPISPPFHNVYMHTIYSFTQGRGGVGGELSDREGEGETDHKAGLKKPT
jgi:hypothetical protein